MLVVLLLQNSEHQNLCLNFHLINKKETDLSVDHYSTMLFQKTIENELDLLFLLSRQREGQYNSFAVTKESK